MPAKYLLPCSCGEKIAIDAGQAGQTLVCNCGAKLVAPTMRGLSSLERVEESETPQKAAAASKRQWSRAQGGMFSGGVIVALLSLIAAGYYSLVYSETQATQSVMRQKLDAVTTDQSIDQLGAADLLTEWKNMTAGGMEEPISMQWQQVAQIARTTAVAIGIALALALGGIVTAATALFWKPKPAR
jgi:hypothetical protein